MRKMMALLLAMALLLGMGTAVMAESGITQMDNVGGIEGSCYYIYQPAEYHNPEPMMTPIIYVYPDKAYESKEDALKAIEEAGLVEIAEAEKGAVVVINPLGETYTKADLDVFEAVQADLYKARNGGGTYNLTYHNLQYAIGEGAGATFINEHLSQNCKRIAGVLTFGGDYNFAYQLYKLPAYIVSGSEEAIEFYKGTNAVDAEKEEEGKTIYYNTANPIQQVIVSKAEATSFDADVIADCWKTMFRYTTRLCLTASSFSFPYPKYNIADYTLMARPNYEAAQMDVIKHGGNPIWEDDSKYWYEFVPAAVKNAKEEETFPLILTLHGAGDNALFEAESNGWAQLAIDHDLLVVSPSAPAFMASDEDIQNFFKLIDYMVETYPVDTSRIYVVGFSMGGVHTYKMLNLKPELFAAAVPMAAPFYDGITIDPAAYEYDIDLPICLITNQFDEHSADCGVLTNSYKYPQAFNDFAALDELPVYEGEIDLVHYPFWGIPLKDTARYMNKTGFSHNVGYLYDADGVPMVCGIWVEDLTHNHFTENAAVIWNWMNHFSRDTETKAVIYSAE